MPRGYVDGAFGQIHYQELGHGDPLVLIHMAPLSSAMYQHLMPLLAVERWVIALDLPGYGSSAHPSAPPTAAELAHSVVDLLNGLGIDSAAVFGHHAGSMIALVLAVNAPERVSRLILSCLPDWPPAVKAEEAKKRVPRDFDLEGATVAALWASTSIEERPASESSLDFSRDMLTAQLQTGRDWYYLPRAVLEPEPADLLPQVTCPVLFIAPEADHFSASQSGYAALVADARQQVLAGKAPNVLWREPALYAGPILDFLR